MRVTIRTDTNSDRRFAQLFLDDDPLLKGLHAIQFTGTLATGLTVQPYKGYLSPNSVTKMKPYSVVGVYGGHSYVRVPERHMGKIPPGILKKPIPIEVVTVDDGSVLFAEVKLEPTDMMQRGKFSKQELGLDKPAPIKNGTDAGHAAAQRVIQSLDTSKVISTAAEFSVTHAPKPTPLETLATTPASGVSQSAVGPVIAIKALTVISRGLSDYYNATALRYDTGWNDARLATELGYAELLIRTVRESLYGEEPDDALTALRNDFAGLKQEIETCTTLINQTLTSINSTEKAFGTKLNDYLRKKGYL